MKLLNTPLLISAIMLSAAIAEARTFTDRNGRKLEAEIVAVPGDQVRIKRADGQEFTLSIASLSPEDQEFIKTWQTMPATIGKPAAPATPTTPAKPGAPAAPAGKADPRATPGAVVALEFPALPKDHNDNPATCNVRIPDDYDPAQPVPLLVWIGGGKGNNQPGPGFTLVDKGHWAIAALPYPVTVSTPGEILNEGGSEKDIKVVLEYHKPMLAEVLKLLPNLDPKLRVVAGFSNGAHTIGFNIERGEKDFIELFNAFVVIEGGGHAATAKKSLKGKFAYLAWGNDISKKGSKDYMAQYFCLGAKDARLTITSHEMDGVGHAFPDTEKALVKDWIEKTVVPGLNAPVKK